MANWVSDIYAEIYHRKENENTETERKLDESAETYQLRMLSASDFKMIRARVWFNEPVYYLTYLERAKELGL